MISKKTPIYDYDILKFDMGMLTFSAKTHKHNEKAPK